MSHVFIVVSGIDGCGKSSILTGAREMLEREGICSSVQWLRFNHVLCKPLHALARVLGLAKKKKMTEGGAWRHEFYRSSLFCRIYLWATYFDTKLGKKKALRRADRDGTKVVFCDRWIPDIIIDLAVKCRRRDLLFGVWKERFMKLLPDDTLLICITRPSEYLLDCRSENREDDDFNFRLEMYDMWSKSETGLTVANDGTLSEATEKICDGIHRFLASKEAI